ncbi:MAG TPA: DUF1345 domain-containing protein [Pseudolabrys sp.]|jgi:uncharacterized membrane protein|nr:DUF1345 domain-containing protein [Pseudolabrys sp.]
MPKHRSAARVPTQGVTRRFLRLHPKLVSAAVFGIVVAVFLPFALRLPTRLLFGWDAGVALYLVLIHAMLGRWDISRIRSRAAEQDEGAVAILLLSIGATLASLVAIVFALGGSTQAGDGQAVLLVLLAAVTILLSWSFVHTIFALHYAHEYYGLRGDSMIGGLKFPDDKEPNYLDFVYFSLVIGMTSQVSDVAVTSKHIRRVVTMHGVLSFFFNLVILALTVNMLSNLVK